MTISAAFSNWAAANLPSVTWGGSDAIRLTPLVRSANVRTMQDDPIEIPYNTLTQLLAAPGWQAISGTQANAGVSTAAASVISSGALTKIGGTLGFTYASDTPTIATGFALSINRAAPNDNLICVFQAEGPVYLTGDPDDNLSQAKINPIAGDGGYLFSYLTYLENGSCNPQLGSISIGVPSLEWEDARAAHVWMFPQRVNYAVNPSFEASGQGLQPYGWRSNATMTKERGGIRPPQGMTPQSRQFCVRLTGSADPKIIESSVFPVQREAQGTWWSLEAAVSGQGQARIGMVLWPEDLLQQSTVYYHTGWFDLQSSFEYETPASPTDEVINQGEFRVLKALVPSPEDTSQAMFRLEFEGTGDVWVDNVLVEPNEAQAGYFDGDWEFGQVGDYSWYTGTGLQDVNDPHKTYSLFYNNRKALKDELFPIEGGGQYTAVSWVPEGASVVPHWDDVFGHRQATWTKDIYIPTPDYSNTSIVTTLGSSVPISPEDD